MKKYIINPDLRIYLSENSGDTKFYLAGKLLILKPDASYYSYIEYLLKFQKPSNLKKLNRNNSESNLQKEFLVKKILIPYSEKQISEYKDPWEYHNWEDFLYFLKSANRDTGDTPSKKNKAKKDKKIFLRIKKKISLPKHSEKNITGTLNSAINRTTIRKFNYQKISISKISFILENIISKSRKNNFDVENIFVYIISINNVEGIENGYYIYNILSHSLELFKEGSTYNELRKIIIGQHFLQGSAFSVFISIDFNKLKTMGVESSVYKKALIKSAEIAHKLILLANSIGLGCFQTPAIRDDDAEKILGTKLFELESVYYIAIGNYEKQPNYSLFAKYYDEVMGDRSDDFNLIKEIISSQTHKLERILDIPSGTGSLANFLSKDYEILGIEKSQQMLDIASQKYPKITFQKGDMVNFDVNKKFSTIICNYDSMNHLISFNLWEKFFINCKKHLIKGGTLIFDINTEKRLLNLSRIGVIKNELKDVNLEMKVEEVENKIFNWNIKIFDKENTHKLCEENILETSFSTKKIAMLAQQHFTIIKTKHMSKDTDKDSGRIYFICKK